MSNDDMASQFTELWQLLFMERSALLSEPVVSGPEALHGTSAAQAVAPGPSPVVTRHVATPEESLGALAPARRPFLPDHGPAVEGHPSVLQLLGQLEHTGPPPAEKEMISSLPVIHVSSEQAAGRLECPVCREEYAVGELVRQLPCLHCFHSDCIVPWLQLHDTCPVCRKSLTGVDHSLLHQTATQEPNTVTTETYRPQNL
ncbi:hypothetical protein P4O66_019682 [Electrophorus voltai]|uniref:RING-type E3 ubiquitin transferase n=1 Tax=Electrophorus voltai TaxID=2609070 RepID=A0AAD8ZU70_9TELE|nr:hypothetical protein P4O66_019682 [Electrophorus voltai]